MDDFHSKSLTDCVNTDSKLTNIKQDEPISNDSVARVNGVDVPRFSLRSPNYIKEEPVDIKEEPIADMYCPSTRVSRPINQMNSFSNSEMKPIADIFCPSTGTSRPIDQKHQFAMSNTWSEYVCDFCGVLYKGGNDLSCHIQVTSRKEKSIGPMNEFADIEQEEPIVDKIYRPPSHLSRPLDQMNLFSHYEMQSIADMYRPSTGNSRPLDQMNLFSQEEKQPIVDACPPSLYHKCVVCDRIRMKKDLHHFTVKRIKRSIWIDAVRSTPEGRNSLSKTLSHARKPQFLCTSHFSPSDFVCHRRSTLLKHDAVPFYVDESAHTGGGSPMAMLDTSNESQSQPMTIRKKQKKIKRILSHPKGYHKKKALLRTPTLIKETSIDPVENSFFDGFRVDNNFIDDVNIAEGPIKEEPIDELGSHMIYY